MKGKSGIRVQSQKLSELLSLNEFESIKPLKKFSDKQGLKTGETVLILSGLILIMVMLDLGGGIICDLIGFVYPAYESFKTLETHSNRNDVWLTYWLVYAMLGIYRVTIGSIFPIIPFFNLLKLIFYIYLFHPKTMGALQIYHNFIKQIIISTQTHLIQHQQHHSVQQPQQQTIVQAEQLDVDDIVDQLEQTKHVHEKKND